ncbi:hypothetical protein FHR32_002066 [Streptosporangium album]|uniref:Uncharacterized protein n=1 Tax=Streptosporangium album TaxID=47479 RepID=A0A7W7RT89_9ACTN|nr:hypothetical protein [Streptosporangium album]MBB4937761.1 hypothetical protein [Streptosporangium album]
MRRSRSDSVSRRAVVVVMRWSGRSTRDRPAIGSGVVRAPAGLLRDALIAATLDGREVPMTGLTRLNGAGASPP